MRRSDEQVPVSTSAVWQVALISGVCGFFLGMAGGWQIAIQSAQAVAGVVAYPTDNPFYMYHVQTWTLLHQVPAGLLKCGVPEQVLTIVLGGLIGMASFQGLALCSLAIGGNRVIAVMTPMLCLASDACADSSATYPIRVLSDQPWLTYGVTGASLTLLIWSLLAVGRRRVAALLLGLAPAIHPALGCWCFGVVLLATLWQWAGERRTVNIPWRWFLSGAAVTVISLIVHLSQTRGLPRVSPESYQPLVEAFANTWDSHRVPFPVDEPIVLVGLCTVVLCCVWLKCFRSGLPAESRFLLTVLLVSAVLGLLLCAATHLQEQLPLAIAMAMPGRYINLVGLAFPAVVLGLLARYRSTPIMAAVLAGLMIQMPLRMLSLDYSWFYIPPTGSVLIAAAFVLLASCREISKLTENLEADESRFLIWIERCGILCLALLSVYGADSDPKFGILVCCGVVALAGRKWMRVSVFDADHARLQLVSNALMAACGVFVAVALLGPAMSTALLLAVTATALFGRAEMRGAPSLALLVIRRQWSLATAMTAALLCAGSFASQTMTSYSALRDWRNDRVFARASKGSGLLLTASTLRSVQLQTRRGVVLEGSSLNQLPYVPQSGPAMNRILTVVYGEDILTPRSFNWQPSGGLKRYSGRALWESRDVSQWRRLSKEFGFTDVVTYSGWSLKLPIVAGTQELTLYHIPQSDAVASDIKPTTLSD